MIKAVLDTNILVSALIMKSGKPARIFAQHRRFRILLSEDILKEARAVLHYPRIRKKYPLTEEAITLFLDSLRGYGEMITPGHVENIIQNDPPDNPVLAGAIDGQADYLVSGNLHFLDLKQYGGVRMITPAQFLEILESLPAET